MIIPIITAAFPAYVSADEGKPGFLTKMVEGTFEFLIKKIIEPFTGFTDPFTLIYDPEKKLYFKIFTVDEWNNIIVRGGNMVVSLAYIVIFVGVLNVIYHLNQSAINPHNRAAFFELGAALLMVALLIRHLQDIYELMLRFNYSIINVFLLDLSVDGSPSVTDMHDGLGGIILYMIYLGLSWWANFYYIMRKFTIIALFILGAIFITFLLFNKTKEMTSAWFRETLANIMVQSIHGVTFWIYLQMDSTSHEGLSGLIEKCILLAVFIPISEGIKHLFNLATGSTDKASFMAMATGTAGLASIYSAGRAAFGKTSPIDRLASRFGGPSTSPTGSEGSAPGIQGGQPPVSAQAPMSAKTNRMIQVGRVFSNIGKGTGMVMGAAFGMSMGPAGVLGSAAVAGQAGSQVGGLVGRSGMAAVHGAQNIGSNVSQSISDELRKKDQNYSRDSLARNSGLPEGVATSYTNSLTSVASGTKQGVVNTFKGKPGESLSDMRQRKMNVAGYMGGVIHGEQGVQSFAMKAGENFDARNPQHGQEISDLSQSKVQRVRVAITREHSYMVGEFKGNDGKVEERRIGNYGGGDPSLKKDEVVFKDYHVHQGRFVSEQGEVSKMNVSSQHTVTPIVKTSHTVSETYKVDSQGSKVITNKDYKINPYDYLPRQESTQTEKYFHPQRMKQGIV